MTKILAQGAEAKIILEKDFVIKNRIKKTYRLKELDDKIRKQRTKAESKLLEKASKIINSPKPFFIPEFYQIKMPFIDGKKLSEHLDKLKNKLQVAKKIGIEIAKLHDADIIHADLTTSNMILVSDDNKSKKIEPIIKKNFEKQLIKLKELNLPPETYAIFGGGPLAIYGIRDSKDIDIVVKPKLWARLIKKYSIQKANSGGNCIKVKGVEIYPDWLPWFKDTEKLIEDADVFKGIRIVKLRYVLEWKKKYGREKDKQDIKLIKEFLNKFEGVGSLRSPTVFFIDFGLGFISNKLEDKAVDLHLLKQALEAKHFKNYKKLWEKVEQGYSSSKNSKKVLERLTAVERRGRYKEKY